MPLAEFFLKQRGEERHGNVAGFDAEARKGLSSRDWSGKVRERKNAGRKAVLLAEVDTISVRVLDETTSVKGFAVREDNRRA